MVCVRWLDPSHEGEQVGVLLDMELYRQLTADQTADPDLLIGLTTPELEALAESKLAPDEQNKMSDLLRTQREANLSDAEEAELERLLARTDQLTILKTRARYTLAQQAVAEPMP
jgi:hypothetical protein